MSLAVFMQLFLVPADVGEGLNRTYQTPIKLQLATGLNKLKRPTERSEEHIDTAYCQALSQQSASRKF